MVEQLPNKYENLDSMPITEKNPTEKLISYTQLCSVLVAGPAGFKSLKAVLK